MATFVLFVEFLAVALVACLFVGYGTIRSLLTELCGLVLDVVKTGRSFSRTSASLAAKLEVDMAKEENKKK